MEIANPEFIMQFLITNHSPVLAIEAREAVEKWGNVNDWRRAIGTGPFFLKEFVSGIFSDNGQNPIIGAVTNAILKTNSRTRTKLGSHITR